MDISRFEDTIVAPATVPGTGAITLIRVSGPDTMPLVDRVVDFVSGSASQAKGYSIRFGTIEGTDEVLVSFFRAPHSYTGEDMAEISCHASSYVASEIMRKLCDAGARPADAGEFTRRAFVNGKMDLAQAEAVADVISSTGSESLRVALNQLRGGFSSELAELRGQLIEVASLLELELDFAEEDVEFASRGKVSELVDRSLVHIRKLTDSFRLGNAIRNGVPVAIAGAANSGKSTLLNSLLGDDRAIVSDIAGTTRDTVEDTMMIDGILFRFIDTAGLRATSDEIEKIGISRSYRKISEASVVLCLLDVTASDDENEASISDIVSKLDLSRQELIVLLNKADLIGPNINVKILNNTVSSLDEKVVKLYISAKNGDGLDDLRKVLVKTQKDLSLESDQTVVTNIRHYNALKEAWKALLAVKENLSSGAGSELLSEDLRMAISQLGNITGEITTDEILGNIFSRFCIGK